MKLTFITFSTINLLSLMNTSIETMFFILLYVFTVANSCHVC